MEPERASYTDILDHDFWRHRIDLGDGRFTPGGYRDASAWEAFGLPDRMDGKSFLDVGASDGLFSFEAERRGATRVLATDIWDRFAEEGDIEGSFGRASRRRGLELVRSYLDSEIEAKTISVFDLDPERVGTFDIVFCSSVLNFVNDPLSAIENLVSVCEGRIVIRNATTTAITGVAGMEYARGDRPDIWLPNRAFFEGALLDAGVGCVEAVEPASGSLPAGVPPKRTALLSEGAVVYADVGCSDERFRVPEGTIVKLLGEHGEASRIEYRRSEGDTPRQGWAPRSRVRPLESGREELLAKSRRLVQEEGVASFAAEVLRELLDWAPLPSLDRRDRNSIVIHGYVN